jgi:hypothetical protein
MNLQVDGGELTDVLLENLQTDATPLLLRLVTDIDGTEIRTDIQCNPLFRAEEEHRLAAEPCPANI